ncbi:MAG: glycosyltransferase family 4 protein, partial [Acidimicrobiales bacterium]
MSHLLVTNDFPPKPGGIQTYLYELWRRLPPEEFTVFTSSHEGSDEFDRAQPFRVVRSRLPLWIPTPEVAAQVRRLERETSAGLVVFDPALPLGRVGRQLAVPYAVVLHGAEVTVPGRLPVSRQLLQSVLSGAALLIAAGEYPAGESSRALPASSGRTVVVPPGVDTTRFQPLTEAARMAARRRFGLDPKARVVVSVSRLVPRKGMDVLIEAVALLARARPDLHLVIGGTGRDRQRLEVVARLRRAPVTFAGFVPDEDLPLLNGTADLWAMLCR